MPLGIYLRNRDLMRYRKNRPMTLAGRPVLEVKGRVLREAHGHALGRGVLIIWTALLTMVSTLAQPRLEVHRPSEDTVEFRWPARTISYALEGATQLAPVADWQFVDQALAPVNGMYSLIIQSLSDAPRFFRLRSSATSIESISPANRETGVAVTRQTIIRFSAPLEGSTLPQEGEPLEKEGNGLYASINGVRLPSRAELSEDGLTVTLSYLDDLPAGSRIRVALDGAVLRDESGNMLDVRGSG